MTVRGLAESLIDTSLFDALFTDATRLYRLQGGDAFESLMVERWRLQEALDAPSRLVIDALSTHAQIDVQPMLGQPLTLLTRLSDGSEHPRAGIVTAAAALESDGGLARYRLTVEPWLGLLAHQTSSRVWQEKSVRDIVDSLFSAPAYSAVAAWAWAECAEPFLAASANAGVRSYTVQYRETDLAFLQRLLAREGLGLRVEPHAESVAGHRVVLFADSANKTSCPEDACSASAAGGSGIRYHRASSQEEQDAIQAFGGLRRLQASRTVALAWDYKAKRAVAAEVGGVAANAGANAPTLEHYTALAHHGSYAWPDAAQAERGALHIQQALEARHKTWVGRGTVRSFTAGTHFTLTQSDMSLLDELGSSSTSTPDRHRFLLTQVEHLGINNLPKELSAQIAKTLGEPEAIEAEDPSFAALSQELITQAAQSGYANRFEAIRAAIVWRPAATAHPQAKPQPGSLTATVVGPNGQTQASGAESIHMDSLGRVRIRFDFQVIQPNEATSPTSTWVRVLQRWAGAGMGAQFIPRVGQQVLVDLVGGDIERPLIVGSLFDGQGEGGISPTPGGATHAEAINPFNTSTDAAPGAQGNATAGRSPAWHGQSPQALGAGGQANAAALSGYKSAEFGNEAQGFNQLVFDDTNGQLRTQLATTAHASQLNLGHLIHQADNHRGSFRGLGFELRTDAYGAVRAGAGVLLSTYGTRAADPAGDNAAGIALQNQLTQLAHTFSRASQTHQTTTLAADIGSFKASAAALSRTQPPAKALHTSVKGMVSAQAFEQAQQDASEDSTAPGPNKVPHSLDATVLLAAQAGQALVAGQDIQVAAQELVHLASGQSTHMAAGGAARIHAGQSIGVLAGAVGPGADASGKGITLVAGSGDIEVQAQSNTLQVAAQKDVSIQSQSAHIDWAAAKKITLATAGGASITIAGGNITVECPGKISIKSATRSFVGPASQSYPLPRLPQSAMPSQTMKFDLRLADAPGKGGHGVGQQPWVIAISTDEPDGMAMVEDRDVVLRGTTDVEGKIQLSAAQEKALQDAYCAQPGRLWVMQPGFSARLNAVKESADWSEDERLRQLMSAADFSADVHLSAFSEGMPEQVRYAKDQLQVASTSALAQSLKNHKV